MAAAAVLEPADGSWVGREYGWQKTRHLQTGWDELDVDDKLNFIAKAWYRLHRARDAPERANNALLRTNLLPFKVWKSTSFISLIIACIFLSVPYLSLVSPASSLSVVALVCWLAMVQSAASRLHLFRWQFLCAIRSM